MSLPDGTIAYDADQVVLAGDMSPEEVSACVGAGVKSWLYLNDAGHALLGKVLGPIVAKAQNLARAGITGVAKFL